MNPVFIIVKYKSLRNGEAVGLYRNVVIAVNAADATKLQLKVEVKELDQANTTVDLSFNGVYSSKFTEQLLALDARRDDDIVGIRLAAKSAQLNRNPEWVKAGKIVLKGFDKYGSSIEKETNRVETTIVRNICDDAVNVADFKEALEVLGLTEWVAAMNVTNNEFEKKFEERGGEFATTKSKVSASQAVINAKMAYDKLLKNIEARNTLDTTGKYTALIDEINKIIKDANAAVKAQDTIAKAKKAAVKGEKK